MVPLLLVPFLVWFFFIIYFFFDLVSKNYFIYVCVCVVGETDSSLLMSTGFFLHISPWSIIVSVRFCVFFVSAYNRSLRIVSHSWLLLIIQKFLCFRTIPSTINISVRPQSPQTIFPIKTDTTTKKHEELKSAGKWETTLMTKKVFFFT